MEEKELVQKVDKIQKQIEGLKQIVKELDEQVDDLVIDLLPEEKKIFRD